MSSMKPIHCGLVLFLAGALSALGAPQQKQESEGGPLVKGAAAAEKAVKATGRGTKRAAEATGDAAITVRRGHR